jgi:ribosomal protein S18 acetylase RimI-like enzyme
MADQLLTSQAVIRTLAVDEWPQYRHLRLRALQTDAQAFSTKYEEMESKDAGYWQSRLRDVQNSEKSWLLFAERDNELLGMIGAARAEGTSSAELISTYVAPEARRSHVAHHLVHELLNTLKRAGIEAVNLCVYPSQSAAIALYNACGFRETSRDAQLVHMRYDY